MIVILCHGVIYSVVVLFGLSVYWFDGDIVLNEYSILLLSWVLLIQFVWTVYSWRILTGESFSPYILFVLSVFAFGGGQCFVEIFGLGEDGVLGRYSLSLELIIASIYMTILGLAALHFGALLAYKRLVPGRGEHSGLIRLSSGQIAVAKTSGVALLMLSIIPVVYSVGNQVAAVTAGVYIDVYNQGVSPLDSVMLILSYYMLPACFLMLIGGLNSPVLKYASIIILILYSFIMFYVGMRSAAAMPLVMLVWLYGRLYSPIPLKALIVSAALLVIVVFPVVGAVRNFDVADRFAIDTVTSIFMEDDTPILHTLAETGMSLRSISFVMQLVPNERSFEYGFTYLNALFSLFPNLFWDLHPAQVNNLNDWLTRTVAPDFYDTGGRYGFSFIAEAYMNFSWFGPALLLVLLGFVFIRFDMWTIKKEPAIRLVVMATIMLVFIRFPRAESMHVIRPIVWYGLGVYIYYYFVKWGIRMSRVR